VQYILLADRWLLAVIFLAAGLAKVKRTEAFAQAVSRYGIVPGPLVAPFAAVLPFVELALGLALAAGALPTVAGWLAAALFAAFGGAMAWNLVHGRRFDCGCGVGGGAPIGWYLAVRNLALIILATVVAVGPSAALAIWPWSAIPANSPPGTALIPVPLTVILVSVVARLAMNFEPMSWLASTARSSVRNVDAADASITSR